MKKELIFIVVLLLSVFLAGCLEYKSADVTGDEAGLLAEIEDLERELASDVEVSEEVVVEEVILPELTEAEEEVLAPEDEVTETQIQVVTVKENELVRLSVIVNDPDQDSVTTTFGMPLNEKGEWKTNYGDAGEYVTLISATDGVLTTEKKVKIVVERVNVAPTIDEVKDITVSEGEVVNFEAVVSDPNNDAVSVDVSEPLTSGSFATDHTSAGEYLIKIKVGDGELETEKSFKLTVLDVNVKPEVTGLLDLIVKEGEKVEITPLVSDLDDDNLVVEISEPVGNDGVWLTDFTDHGEYFVTVSVSDGKDLVTQKVKLVVEDVNMPPEIVEIQLVSS